MRMLNCVACALIVMGSSAAAQRSVTRPPKDTALRVTRRADTTSGPPTVDSLVFETVRLKHLSVDAAIQLLSPYVEVAYCCRNARLTLASGVFPVSAMRAVTIRATPGNYPRLQKLLADYDRSPATISLYFQLVAADNTPTRDPAVAPLDSLLRGVLKFTGYHLLGTAVATATEGDRAVQTISADGDRMTLEVILSDGPTAAGEGTVHLSVRLTKSVTHVTDMTAKSVTYRDEEVIATGVNVPLGQTVVLGTAASGSGDRALILTVKPQLAGAKPR